MVKISEVCSTILARTPSCPPLQLPVEPSSVRGDHIVHPTCIRHIRTETLQQRIRHAGEELHTRRLQPINKPSAFNHHPFLSKQVRPFWTKSFLAVWLSRIATVEADSLAGRVWRGRKLLDKVIHSPLDLLDVAFYGIHTMLELGNLTHLLKSIQQHLAQDTSRPLAEARSLKRFYPVTNRNYHIQIIDGNRTTT